MSVSRPQTNRQSGPPTRLSLPFIDTGPLFDIRWLLLLFPVWWALGIEQFIWPFTLGFAAIKVVLLQRYRIIVVPPLKWFALYLLAILVSSLFIIETFRWFTYIRNFGAYISGFLILLIITNRAGDQRNIDKLLNAVLIAMIVTGVVGALGMLDVWRPSFESVAGRLFPSSIASTSYGQLIANRSIGGRGWFTGLGEYFRLSGFFLYGTHYASAIVYVLPFLFLRLGQGKLSSKIAVSLSIILLIVNLILTTGRVAVVSLLGGGLYFVLFHSFHRRTIRALMALGLTIAIILLLLTALIDPAGLFDGDLATQTAESLNALIFARGEGSFTDRFAVYSASFEGFAQRPIFGWGTERDVPGIPFPAGSHSEYIAVAYRQGLIGLLFFVGLLVSSWRMTRPPRGLPAYSPEGNLLRYGRWFFVTALLNSLAADPALDTTVYVILWLVISLLIVTSQLIKRSPPHVAR